MTRVLPRCGQFFAPAGVRDRETGQVPGTVVFYTVATIHSDGSVLRTTSNEFKSPWLAEIEVNVVTESSAPVEGVHVSVSHVDGATGDVDEKYDPLVSGETDFFGIYVTTVRVTDLDWTSLTQHFTAVCSKTTSYEVNGVSGSVEHTFDPAVVTFAARHLREKVTEVIDETSVGLSGYARFNFTDATGSGGSWPGGCVYAQGDACYCPVASTIAVEVVRADGEIEKHATDDEGRFSTSVAYGEHVTVRLGAWAGNDGLSSRAHAFAMVDDVDDAEDRVAAGTTPSATFVAVRDHFFEFVHAESVVLEVGVLGGDGGAAFVTGQRVTLELESCGFEQDFLTYAGQAARASAGLDVPAGT